MTNRLDERASFDHIRYANCWEDGDVLCAALVPAPGRRMLSIASGGDNSFALLAAGAEVVAADLSPAQLACVRLKAAAVEGLGREEVLVFLGLRPGDDRLDTYRGLRSTLPPGTREFWDRHPGEIRGGIAHAGRFERFFRLFRLAVLPLIHRKDTVDRLLADKPESGRRAFYDQVWDSRRWRLLFRLFFSRFLLGRLGRDPEFFRYVRGPVSERILARTRHALTALPTHDNPYLSFILRGRYGSALPRYLRPSVFDAVREGLGRLTLFSGPVEKALSPGGGFDGFNLSDIFEYLPPSECTGLYGKLLAGANHGARLAYWNMLVPRSRPEEHADRVRRLDSLSSRLFEADRAFFYSAFHVDEVRR